MTPPIEVPEGWTPRTCEFCHQVIAPRVAETQLSYERRRYCSREHAGLARRGKPRARQPVSVSVREVVLEAGVFSQGGVKNDQK